MIRIAIALLAFTGAAAADIATLPFTERFSALAPLAAKKSTLPTLKPAATVAADVVRIGDLVDNAGAAASLAIFRAPELGETGTVSVARVLDALAAHDMLRVDAGGLTDIMVIRASHAITPTEIEARVTRALTARVRATEAGNLTLTFDSELRTLHVAPGAEARIARLTFDPRTGRFDVFFELPGSASKFLRLTGTYAETFEAAVLSRPLGTGEVVKASDFTIARRPKAEFAPNVVTAAAQAVGLAARRPMRPGQLIRQTDLMKPEVVARNDNVTITYEVPGIVLTMRGKALETGATGDIINVLNTGSNKAIQATIAGPGHVVVASRAAVVTSMTQAPAPRVAANAPSRSVPNPNPRGSAE
jgi:flagellar basal body P-ring formation protein FlgA